jgi:hypothetical protein
MIQEISPVAGEAESHHVNDELNEHLENLRNWTTAVASLNVPTSHLNVTQRFARDCQTLISDIEDDTKEVSTADLCDFTERRNSLEIQYHNLTEEYQ